MPRGKGTLEVRPSRNPFFQSTHSDLGTNPHDRVEWTGNPDPGMKTTQFSHADTFSFLYSRESDRIGGKVSKPVFAHPQLPSKTEFLKKRRDDLQAKGLDNEDHDLLKLTQHRGKEYFKTDVNATLQVWKQGTKEEDPRYTTTNNEIGKKMPTYATYVAERFSRQQGFSNSFNGVKPMNSGLNCGLSKSSVHAKLDPQFA